jgi:hypothetical protein
MKKLIFIILFVVNSIIAQTTVVYNPTSETVFNPERGFFKFTGTNSTNYSLLNLNTLNGYKNGVDKISLIYRGFYLSLDNIPQSYLNNIQTDFNTIRQSGLKVIVRFAYSETTNCGTNCQPNKNQIITHIQQLSNVLNTNKDVIATIQMGFIGGYGEWYYTNSTEFGTESYTNYTNTQWQNRKEVVDALLNAVPDISIQLRYPYAKTKMYGTNYKNKVGYFNDAFLNTYGDNGFFPIGQNSIPSQTQIQDVVSQTKYNPLFGESNGVNTPRTNGSNAIQEMILYKWQGLNRNYHPDVINGWINDGNFNTIRNRLGYRYVLKSSQWQIENSLLKYRINIKNEGFANPYTKKNVYIVLNDSVYINNIDLKEQGSDFIIEGEIDISNLSNGLYETYLWIPDNNLPTRQEYSIRIVNSDVEFNGKNKLNYSFQKTNLNTQDYNKDIILYPNPTKDYIYLNNNYNYNLYDILGKHIFSDFNNIINLSNLKNGVYLLKVENIVVKKIIKI